MRNLIPAIAMIIFCSFVTGHCLGQVESEDPSQDQYDLLVRFAKAKRDLAKVELDRVISRKVAFPPMLISRLRAELAVAEEHLRQTEAATTDGIEEVRRRHAVEQLRLAEKELETGKKLRKTITNFSSLDLKRLQLKHDVAKLKLELINNPATFVTMMDSMEQKMNRFSEEILSLEQRIARLENPGK